MSEAMCRCGHERRRHDWSWATASGRCRTFTDGLDDPFEAGARWTHCQCKAYDDSVLPESGERLVFGVHRQPSVHAETAEAWPSMPSWSARVKARTTRALRSLR